MGWVRVWTQRGVIITGSRSTSCRRISQLMLPSPITMPGPQRGGRSAVQQDRLDLAAAAQVRRQVVGVVAQAAQVDDLAQAGAAGRVGERLRARAVLVGEVGSASECTR